MSDVEELKQELYQQQMIQKKLCEQIQCLNQKLNEHNVTKFNLTPDQIIRNFNEIPPFSGEDSYKLRSFLKSVQDVESLCGENNIELKCYCLKKIINNKIIGVARSAIMEIPESHRSWTNVVQQLRMKFRPKHNIHQLLFHAKDLKVHNLKDLFNKLNRIKSDCSEICDFDNADLFTYTAIDKELVQILRSKIVPIAQYQIELDKSLFELDNSLCQTEIYLSDDIIKIEYKINKNSRFNDKKFNNINSFRRNEPHSHHNHRINDDNRNNNNHTNNRYTNNNNNNINNRYTNNNNNTNNRYTSNNRYTNSNNFNNGQFKRQFDDRNGPLSGQYRNTFNRQEPNSSNRQVEPMEVENITNELNYEVNFIETPHQTNFP